MNKQERIEELQEKMSEFILNESVFADDHPSWGEVAEAQAIAEAKWDETDEGKELKALLSAPKKMTIRTDEYSRTWYYVDLETGNIWYDGIKPSGQWKFQGFSRINGSQLLNLAYVREHPEVVNAKWFWFKNGKSQFRVRDLDHGTTREWGSRILGVSIS